MKNVGLIKRMEHKELPPRVEYQLTSAEIFLMPILHVLVKRGKLIMY